MSATVTKAAGRVMEMGEVTTVESLGDERTTYPFALVIEFKDRDSLREAISSGACTFGASRTRNEARSMNSPNDSLGVVSDAERIANLCKALSDVVAERDAAFSMSRCECASDECCANLVALHQENERLRAALQYVLDDEPSLMPRASSKCREFVRRALSAPNARIEPGRCE